MSNGVHWSLDYPDTVLSVFGVSGGSLLGFATSGLFGALLGAGAMAAIMLLLTQVEPHPPEHGPHQ